MSECVFVWFARDQAAGDFLLVATPTRTKAFVSVGKYDRGWRLFLRRVKVVILAFAVKSSECVSNEGRTVGFCVSPSTAQ